MANDLQTVPLFGLGTKGKSPTITAQRRLNLYVEPYPEQTADKGALAYIGRPGLTRIAYGGAPIRGFGEQVTFSNAGQLQQAITLSQGTQLYGYATGPGLENFFSPIRTSSGYIESIYNGVQQLLVDGRTGYVLNWSTQVVTVLEDLATSFPAGATSCAFIGGRAVVDDPSTIGRFRWSGVYDFTSWAALDFATAESSADPLVFITENYGQLLLWGRDTIEFWAPTGDTRVFARIGGSGVDYGLAAKRSVAKIAGGVAFLGRSRAGGERQVFFLQGQQVQEISDADVVADINASSNPDAATGVAYVIAGHPFYQLNLPETTWIYDFKAGNWDEAQTDGGRHASDRVIAAFGMVIAGDYRDGRIYKYDVSSVLDDANSQPLELITKHVLANYERMTIAELFVDMEVGSANVPGIYEGALVDLSPYTMVATAVAAAAPSTASYSMECWARFDAFAASTMVLMAKNSVGSPELYYNGSTSMIFDFNGSNPVSFFFVLTGNLGVWNHFAVTYDSVAQQSSIYFNGVLQAQTGGIANGHGTDAATDMRYGNSAGAVRLQGALADMRVWNYVRTQALIVSQMNSMLTGTEAGLVSLYNQFVNNQATQLDQTSGKVLTLSGSYGFDARQIVAPRDAKVMLSWSMDGGRTFGSEAWASLGLVGNYMTRVLWRMLGRTRDRVIKLRITDPVKRVIVNAGMRVG